MLTYTLATCGDGRVRLIVSGDDTLTVLASAEMDLVGQKPSQAATALIRAADTDAAGRGHDLAEFGRVWKVTAPWPLPALDPNSLYLALRAALRALQRHRSSQQQEQA